MRTTRATIYVSQSGALIDYSRKTVNQICSAAFPSNRSSTPISGGGLAFWGETPTAAKTHVEFYKYQEGAQTYQIFTNTGFAETGVRRTRRATRRGDTLVSHSTRCRGSTEIDSRGYVEMRRNVLVISLMLSFSLYAARADIKVALAYAYPTGIVLKEVSADITEFTASFDGELLAIQGLEKLPNLKKVRLIGLQVRRLGHASVHPAYRVHRSRQASEH